MDKPLHIRVRNAEEFRREQERQFAKLEKEAIRRVFDDLSDDEIINMFHREEAVLDCLLSEAHERALYQYSDKMLDFLMRRIAVREKE